MSEPTNPNQDALEDFIKDVRVAPRDQIAYRLKGLAAEFGQLARELLEGGEVAPLELKKLARKVCATQVASEYILSSPHLAFDIRMVSEDEVKGALELMYNPHRMKGRDIP
jgi:hypothetical protein